MSERRADAEAAIVVGIAAVQEAFDSGPRVGDANAVTRQPWTDAEKAAHGQWDLGYAEGIRDSLASAHLLADLQAKVAAVRALLDNGSGRAFVWAPDVRAALDATAETGGRDV